MAGLVSTVGEASYGATKHAVVSISKTLRIEAQRHGVLVSGALPRRDPHSDPDRRRVRSHEPGRRQQRARARAVGAGPAHGARQVREEGERRAVLRGDAIIILPSWWKAFWYLERISPALSMRFAKLALKRIRELDSTGSRFAAGAVRRVVGLSLVRWGRCRGIRCVRRG